VSHEQFDTRLAFFTPKRTDDLRPIPQAMIGCLGEWQCSWVIEEGSYEGQHAWLQMDSFGLDDFIGWVPTEDLEFPSVEQQAPRESA